MKKFTLFAAAAAVALGASAQGAVAPGIARVLEGGKIATLEYVALDEFTVADLESKGVKVQNIGPNDAGRQLFIWASGETLQAYEAGMPGVDDQTAGFLSMEVVAPQGWSGAGYNISKDEPANTTMWNDETHFHLAYCTPSNNAPASIAITVADGLGDCGSAPAKFALGPNFDDNGTVIPSAAPAATDEWQAIDITFADLKKMWPGFDYKAITGWCGNIMAFVPGGVAGKTFAFDAIYFYNYGDGSGISNIAADETDIVITGRTVNAHGAAGIALYDLTGKTVKATAGTTLGIDNAPAGLYIVKAGNAVRKVLVK